MPQRQSLVLDPSREPGERWRAVYACRSSLSRGRLIEEPGSRDPRPSSSATATASSTPPPSAGCKHKTQVFVCSRGRPLPHPADPHDRGGADRPGAGPLARARRGPRRGAGAGARPRPHALRPYRRGRPGRSAWRAIGGFDHNAQALRIVTRAGAALCRFRRPQPDLGNAGGAGQAQRPAPRCARAGRSLRYAGDAAFRVAILEYQRAAGSGTRRAMPAAEAQAAAIADDIAYDAHDIDDGLRAGLFELSTICARCRSSRDAAGRDRAPAIPGWRTLAPHPTSWSGGSSPASSRT